MPLGGFCNLKYLRPAGLYERCKLAFELKRLKTTGLGNRVFAVHNKICISMLFLLPIYTLAEH